MDGFIRIVQKNSSLTHDLWQIWFPKKLLVEFENGDCRIVPSQYVDGQLAGFKHDQEKLVYMPEESLDLLIEAASTGSNSPEAHEIIDELHSQFCKFMLVYEKRFVRA
jgi:hypothetical protein